MAERLKDEADKKLESLFRSDPVQDDGFSLRIIKRVRRQIWVRRLTMPVAIAIGALIAAKPLAQLVAALPEILAIVPNSVGSFEGLSSGLSAGNLPQLSTVILGAMLLGAVMMIGQILED